MKKCGIVDPVVARKLYGEAMREAMLTDYRFPTKPSSDGYYHIQIPDETKNTGRRQVKAKTLDELKDKVLQSTRKTFRDVFYEMLDEKKLYLKGDRIYSVENSIAVYEKFYNRCFTKFGSRIIETITDIDIEEFVGKTLIDFDLRQAAYGTLKCILNQTLHFGFRHGYIFENPCLKVDFSSRKFTSMLTDDVDIGVRLYDSSEMNRILSYIRRNESDEKLGIGFYALEFQILTGMRKGEVCPLTWEDIKEEDGVSYILVHKETIRVFDHGSEPMYQNVSHTKTYKNRKVPIWDELNEFLVRLKDQGFSDKWLFPGRGPDGCLKPDCLYARHRKVCKEVKVEVDNGRRRGTHAYRRNFAKRIDDPRLATKILGNTEKVLSRHYYDGYDLSAAVDVVNKRSSLVNR